MMNSSKKLRETKRITENDGRRLNERYVEERAKD
jgi:hypothetical protein